MSFPIALILDDFVEVRKLTRKVLEGDGIEVMDTGNEREAFRLLRDGEARFLLQDFTRGPGTMGGAALTHLLRSTPQTASIPIIMITGTSRSIVEQGFADYGLTIKTDLAAFLEKPCQLSTIQALGRSLIKPVLRG